MVEQACKLDSAPAGTATKVKRSDLPKIKSYLQDVDPVQAFPRLAEANLAAGIAPEEALIAQPVVVYLKQSLPKSEYELTALGLRQVVAPSFSEDTRFLWKCRIAENPYYIMNLFSQRQLTAQDVECLRAMYESIYQELSTQLVTYIIENYSTDASISRPLRTMLSIFLGQPVIKLEQLVAYKSKPEPAAPPPQGGQAPNTANLESERVA
jgi:hypothetical protein